MNPSPTMVFITSADTEVLAMSVAVKSLPADFPPVRIFNATTLSSEEAIGRTILEVIHSARIVVMRLLGGQASFRYLVEQVTAACSQRRIPLLVLPGDLQFDPECAALSSVPLAVLQTAFQYLLYGGAKNLLHLLLYLSDAVLGSTFTPPAPRSLPWDGIYHPSAAESVGVEDYLNGWVRQGLPTAGLVFYRAHWVSGDLEWVDAMIRSLESEGFNVIPVFVYSLRQPYAPEKDINALRRFFRDANGRSRIDVLVTTLGYTIATLSGDALIETHGNVRDLELLDVPVIQAMVCAQSRSEWERDPKGFSPMDVAMNVVMPEFDGRIISVPIAFKERIEEPSTIQTGLRRTIPHLERLRFVAKLAANFAGLRRTPKAQKRIAILLSNYPNKTARIGNAVGLDTAASVLKLLRAMAEDGYHVTDIPASAEKLMERLTASFAYDPERVTDDPSEWAVGSVDATTYGRWFAELPEDLQHAVRQAWGEPPGQLLCSNGKLVMTGVTLGNAFIGVQPPRGFGENPIAVYHSPDLPPTHYYLAYYRWLQQGFNAHAVIHVGKHGNLEWLPGKSLALSCACWPEVILSELPHFYPFIINNPGEGSQAKRRTHATIIDHLIPPMTHADTYNELAQLEQLLDEHAQLTALDPAKLPLVEAQIWEVVQQTHLHRDLQCDRPPENFSEFIRRIDGYLCELKSAQIRDGLHILGQPPSGEQEVGLLCALIRLDNGEIAGLPRAIAEALGIDPAQLRQPLGEMWRHAVPDRLRDLDPAIGPRPWPGAQSVGQAPAAERDVVPQRGVLDGVTGLPAELHSATPIRTIGDVSERIERLGRTLIQTLQSTGYQPSATTSVLTNDGRDDTLNTPTLQRLLTWVCEDLVPRIRACRDELRNLVRGLNGRFIPAGPSGAPTRGMAHVLPTGRNFYSVDIRTIPSPSAWAVGAHAGEALLEKYRRDTGQYPRAVGMTLWGTSTMRTSGDELAQALWLLGVKPVWQRENRRVIGLEVVSLENLQRPRIDVVVRVSGFFRDAFPNGLRLLDQAVDMVARLEEAPQDNYVRSHVEEDLKQRLARGEAPAVARRHARFRVFSSKPGTYGVGLLALIEAGNWHTDQDLAEVYIGWGAYAYTRESYGEAAREAFQTRLSQVAVAVKHQDNREHDIFDSDDYFQFHGGMIAAVRALSGTSPRALFADTAQPDHVRVRDLADEARRVLRTRVVNPKWIEGVKRHGYKGAVELAATVDYLFGYDATAHLLEDWMYEHVVEAYALDPTMQEFFRQHNPWALRDMIQRFFEAMDRGLWQHPSDQIREALQRLYLETEGVLEQKEGRRQRDESIV